MNPQKFEGLYDYQSKHNLYRLSGIIVHTGTADSGHYTSYIRYLNPF